MKNMNLAVFFLVTLFIALPMNVQAGGRWVDLPTIKPLRGMQVDWVAKKMRLNGLQMSMQTFTADMPPDELIEKYERRWRSRVNTDSVRSKNASADVLGIQHGKYYYSIQVAATGRNTSAGTLAVSISPSNLKPIKPEPTEFLIPRDAGRVSRIEALDGSVESETLSFDSQRKSEYLSRWYETRMREDGWSFQNKTEEFGIQLFYQRAQEHAMINIVESPLINSGSSIQITWVKN